MLKNISFIVLLIFLLFFGFSNGELVKLNLLPGFVVVETKLYLVIFLSFLAGFSFCFFGYSYKFLTFKLANFKHRRRIKILEKEVTDKEDGYSEE